MRCNLTVNTKTAYLNTDIVFECDSQSVRLKDYLTGQEYYVNRKLKIRLIAGKHDFLCIDNGEKFSIFVHDAIKLGGGRIKALASYIDDECPWIILTTSDRMYGHNRLTGYEFIEHKLTTESIKWLRNDIFLLQSSSENIIIDVLTKRILLSTRNILFCNAKFAIYKTHYKSIILYNVFDITSEEIIISTEYPVSITTIDGSENVLFYVKDLNVRRLNLETKNDEKIEVSLYDKFIQINRWSLNSFENYIIARDKIIDLINGRNNRSLKLDELASVSIFGKFLQGNRLLFNFFKQYIIVNDEIINLINGKCNKIPLIEGCRITKIFNTGSDGYVNEVSITRIDTTINDLIVWYEVLLHENKKICKKRVKADIYNGTYEFVNSIPYQNLAEQRCVLERNYNNVILPQICSGKSITCSRQGNLFLYENYGKIYFYDKRNEESYLILEDLYDSTNCQNAFFTTDGKNLIISDTGNSLKLYDIEGGKYNSFEIKEFTSFKFFKGVYNGYIPELSIRINPSDCTKPIWKDPFSLKTIDPYELKEFAYVSSDGHYVAESKIEREYVNLISGNTIKGEEYNQLVQLYDYTKNGREEEIIKNRKDLCRYKFFDNKCIKEELDKLENFTRLFIEKRCWLNIHDKLTNEVRRIFIGVNVTYLNYVSFSYDSRYVAIGGKIYEGSNQPGIFVLYDLVDDKYIVEGSRNELQAVWMTLFNKIGDCAFYDSCPNTYIYSASSNYKEHIKIENRSLLCFSPSGRYIVLSKQGYTRYSGNDVFWGHQFSTMVYLYSIEKNKEIEVFNDLAENVRGIKNTNNVAAATFSSDEKRLLIIGEDGVVVIRSLSDVISEYKPVESSMEILPLGVREIKAKEFLGNTSLKRVVIPNGVTKIGEYAFQGCTLLEKLEIPDSVTVIEKYAFSQCPKLKHVVLSKNLSKIEEDLFWQCTSLESIEIPYGVTEIEKCAFLGSSELKIVVIPNSVTKIGEYAFQGCTSLENLEIPDSVTVIEKYAFSKCPKLKHVVLSKNLSKIEEALFWQCTSLESIEIPNGVTEIGAVAFLECSSLRQVVIPNTVAKLSELAFTKCTSLESIEIPYGVTEIEKRAFLKCSNLRSVVIPNSVTKIGEYAFQGCTSLESIYIPYSVTEIGEYAFSKCAKLRHITLPKKLLVITDHLFWQCNSLESVLIPNSLEKINGSAFKECTSLESIKLPDSIIDIEEYAFSYCSKLLYITLPSSLSKIKHAVFLECSSLKRVVIPKSVIDIDGSAFAGCVSLEINLSQNLHFIVNEGVLLNKEANKIVSFLSSNKIKEYSIPNSIVEIGSGAFSLNPLLEYVKIPERVKEINSTAFCNVQLIKYLCVSENNQYFSSIDGILYSKDMTTLKRVPIAKNLHFYRIPETITKIGAHAFCGCTVECVEIPSGVIEIGSRAFDFNQINELHINIKDIMKCTIDDEVFGNEKIFDTCVLYVPSGAYSIYKRHPIFSKFRNYLAEDPPF